MVRRLPWLLVVLAVAGAAWVLLGAVGPDGSDGTWPWSSRGDAEATDEELTALEAEWDAAPGFEEEGTLHLGGGGRAPVEGRPGEEEGGEDGAAAAPATGADVRFGGVVSDPEGRPAGGVAVVITGTSGKASKVLETDASGRFRTALPAGRYHLSLTADGVGGLALPNYVVDGALGADVEFALRRMVRLAIQVKRAGTPVDGATVSYAATQGVMGASTKTDVDGIAVFDDVVAGGYVVDVAVREAETITRRVQVRKDEDLAFDIPPGVALRGEVRSAEGGGPVQGARLRATVRASSGTFISVTDVSLEDGRYEMEVPRGRVIRFDAVADGFASWPARKRRWAMLKRLRPIAKGRAVELAVALERGLRLEGVVTDEGRQPVPGLALHFATRRGAPLTATTGEDGGYVVTGVRPERYIAVVLTRGWHTAKALRVRVPKLPPESVHEFDFQVFRTISVEGEVVHGNKRPAVGARVWITGGGKLLRAAHDAGRLLETFTDVGGRWRLDDLPPDRGVAVRAALGALEARPRGFKTSDLPDEPLRLVLAATVLLQGRVLDVSARTPIPRANVRIVPDGPPGGRTSRTVRTDASGEFEAAELIPGAWLLTASLTGYLKAEPYRVELRKDEEQHDATLHLDPGRVIGGVVTTVTGQRLAKVGVSVDGVTRDGGRVRRKVVTNARGVFRITGFEPGAYKLRARRDGFRPATVADLRGGEAQLHVRMKPRPPPR